MDKDALRAHVWSALETAGAGAFPFPLRGRIPNFKGAAACAARLPAVPEWREARVLKCNPDAPQRYVRRLALREGKQVLMAVPRLTEEACFLRLDPRRLVGRLDAASSIRGAFEHGEPVTPDALPPIDLIVAGSVAVDRAGGRVGKGGGYSDLEFALARELGRVREETPVLTTVHPLQVVEGEVPMTPHDVPVDLVVTPDEVIRTNRRRAKPAGILWGHLSDAQIEAMPPVARLRPA